MSVFPRASLCAVLVLSCVVSRPLPGQIRNSGGSSLFSGGSTNTGTLSRSSGGRQESEPGFENSLMDQMSLNEIGSRRNENGGFVGANISGMAEMYGDLLNGMRSLTSQFNSGRRGNTGRRGNNGRSNQGANDTPSMSFRPRLVVGFIAPTISPNVRQQQVQQRINLAVNRERGVTIRGLADGISISVDDNRTATLQGTVSTQHDRDLARRLVLLQPGISSVRDELTLQTALELAPEVSSAP